jgi:hypothetical protein
MSPRTNIVTLSNGNRRSHFTCAVATSTGYFASRNAAGITEIRTAHPDMDHKIPAYGELSVWSCAGPKDATPVGQATALICPGNHLTRLSLSALVALERLDASFNDLVSLDLTGLPALQTLVLTTNRLASLNVRGLSRLKTLDCCGNLLTSLDLSGLGHLQVLDCSANQILSLKLGGCNGLRTLYAHCNQIAGLDLSECPRLRDCDLAKNPCETLAGIPPVQKPAPGPSDPTNGVSL